MNSGQTIITIIGNLTSDPELRFTPNGAAVANFTIASTPRTFDRQANEWKDGETLFMRCSLWREAAENVTESLTKGTRVIAQGRLKQRSFEQDGQRRTVVEMDVDEIGPSLRYAAAQVRKVDRRANGGQPSGGEWSGGGQQQGQQSDPWASGGFQGQQQGGGWNAAPAADGEPPF